LVIHLLSTSLITTNHLPPQSAASMPMSCPDLGTAEFVSEPKYVGKVVVHGRAWRAKEVEED